MKACQLILMTLLSMLILFSAGNLSAGIVLYDDFSTGKLDGKKWRQRTYIREIVNEKFASKLGNRSPGMGAEVTPGYFRNHLPITSPDSVNAIECEISVEEVVLDSAADARSGAMILGYFYNSKSTGNDDVGEGDIFAYLMIGKGRNEVEGLQAFWIVAERDSNGVDQVLPNGNGTINGFSPSGTGPFTAKISYDGNKTFTFTVDGNTKIFEGPARERAALKKLKSLSTGINAVNGSNNGYISAAFDNVKINDQSSIYDDFSAVNGLIDLTKWDYMEWLREVSDDGSLRLGGRWAESNRSYNTYFTEKDAPYIEAKALIESGTQLSTGTYGIGRLQGYYYNESKGSGSGQSYNQYEGDVFVQIRLRRNYDGSMSADAFVDRSNTADESDWTNLFAYNFTVQIFPDTYYTLSIRFEGKKLIFSCAGETAEFNILTPIFPAYGEHRALRSRVYLDEIGMGYIKVLFDDVYIEKKVKIIPSLLLLLLDQ
jgi:hypothetical protein